MKFCQNFTPDNGLVLPSLKNLVNFAENKKKQTMKQIVLTLSLICLIITGCSSNNEPIEVIDETQTIDLAEYEEVVYKNRELLSDWAYAMQDAQEEGTRAASLEEAECFDKLKDNLLPSATQFASELNITKEDLEAMTGVEIHDNEEFENTLVGLMLFVTTTDCSIVEDEIQTRGGSFKDCFIEATGIGAGVALVAGLSKGVVSKAVVKATLKLVAKVGTRTLSGAGLALMAAEIAWCMW